MTATGPGFVQQHEQEAKDLELSIMTPSNYNLDTLLVIFTQRPKREE